MMHHFSVTLRGGGPFWCHLDKERRCKKCFPEALLLFAFAYITFFGWWNGAGWACWGQILSSEWWNEAAKVWSILFKHPRLFPFPINVWLLFDVRGETFFRKKFWTFHHIEKKSHRFNLYYLKQLVFFFEFKLHQRKKKWLLSTTPGQLLSLWGCNNTNSWSVHLFIHLKYMISLNVCPSSERGMCMFINLFNLGCLMGRASNCYHLLLPSISCSGSNV